MNENSKTFFKNLFFFLLAIYKLYLIQKENEICYHDRMFGLSKSVSSDQEIIEDILNRGVEDILVFDSLRKKLNSGKKLRIKLGFDPTGSKIHLGRAVVLRKLRQFQRLGHQVVFLVGDFTAQIGDPSDKLEKRPMLSEKEVKNNLKDYINQVAKILDASKIEVVYNKKWLSKLTLEEVAKLAESFSVQQMISRRNFKTRIEAGQDISMREFLYPLMQGYDSVQLKADIEIGGFDQLFNLKAGRIIQKHYGQPEQDVLTIQMLEGLDGRKMSTSWGNVVNIVDEPNDMYGKIMSLKDELIPKYFLLCTDLSQKEINEIVSGDPKSSKMRLAYEIVSLYHGKEKAKQSQDFFVKTFSKKEVPDDVEKVDAQKGQKLMDVLVENNILSSKSDFRRLVSEGAITNLENNQKIEDPNFILESSLKLKVGKKKFIKVVL